MAELANLTRVPIPFILEQHTQDDVTITTLPNGPASMEIHAQPPVKLQRTFGTRPIRQHSSPNQWNIVISGLSGLRSRAGYNHNGEVTVQTGPKILEEFADFIHYYSVVADLSGAAYLQNADNYEDHLNNVFMVFRALPNNLHLYVEPVDFIYSQNAHDSRFMYNWTLTLDGYALADQVLPENLLGTVAEWAKTAAKEIGSINTTLGKAANVLTNTRADLDVLRLPFQQLRVSVQLLRQLISTTASINSVPREMLADLAVTANAYIFAWQALFDAGKIPVDDAFAVADGVLQAFYAAADMARAAMSIYGGLRGGPEGLAAAEQNLINGSFANAALPFAATPAKDCIVYQISFGETLKDIASKLLGSTSLWLQIAYLNGFPDAYHHSDGSPLAPGDTILVPSPTGSQGVAATGDLDALYGVDWFINPVTGDVALNEDADDFLTITGLPNLRQGLRLRLLSEQGTSCFKKFGLPVAPGQATSATMAGYIGVHVREQILLDPRVENVTDLAVLDGGDSMAATCKVKPISAGSFALTAPFPVA